MAKKKALKQPLKNYTVEQLLTMDDWDLNSMSAREMRHAVRTLNLAANKRIARLTKAIDQGRQDISSRGLYTGKGDLIEKFTIRRKADVNEARNKFKVVANFLNRKTTTMEGAKKEFDRQYSRLFDNTEVPEDFEISRDELNDLWSEYRKLDEQQVFTEEYDSDRAQQKMGEMYVTGNYTNEEIIKKIADEISETKKKIQRKKDSSAQLARKRQFRTTQSAADLRDMIRGI